MENEININELVMIKTLPSIYYQLDLIADMVIEKTKYIDTALAECTEENKQEIKKYKTYLNSIKNELEDKRKEIKKEIMKPYDEFNDYYEEKVKGILTNGITKLTDKINEIENKQLEAKFSELKDFFEEYLAYYHLEGIVTFEDLEVKVNLSNSLKMLKEGIKNRLEAISEDIVAISSCEYRDEVLLEYQKNGFVYSKAVNSVNEQKARLKELAERQQHIEETLQKENEVVAIVDEVIVPEKVDETADEELTITFTVTATKEKLVELRNFMKERGIIYE